MSGKNVLDLPTIEEHIVIRNFKYIKNLILYVIYCQ